MEQKALSKKMKEAFPDKVWGIRAAAATVVIVGLYASSKVLWGAVEGGAGLLVLGVMGAAFVGVIKTIPLLGQKLENRILAARKAEARKNPVEQLENALLEKEAYVKRFKDAVSNVGAQVAGRQDMLNTQKQKKPNFDYSRNDASMKNMDTLYVTLRGKYVAAEAALLSFREVVEQSKFDYAFANAGNEALFAMGMAEGKDLLTEILKDEAFSAIRDNFNKVFADLDLEAAKLNSLNEINFGEGLTLDVSAIHLPLKDSVSEVGMKIPAMSKVVN